MTEANRIVAKLGQELERRGVKLPIESALYDLPKALDELERLAVERYLKSKEVNEA